MLNATNVSALLIIGPTGSGKTPLGDYLHMRGQNDRRYLHFDFGDNLRRIAANGCVSNELSAKDMQVIHHSLATGALLENENFHIALKIVSAFISENRMRKSDTLILNGLPRHIGQAHDMTAWVAIRAVLNLTCSAVVVKERIRVNSGGDRTSRKDDSLDEIKAKLAIFHERTLPLIDFYQRRGVRVHNFPVGIDTTAEDIVTRWQMEYSV